MIFNILIEGHIDEAVARKILNFSGHESGVAYGKKGWTYIHKKIAAFDRSCSAQGLLTLVDLMDTRLACPATVVDEWLPSAHINHVFRIVVREIESWVLADRENIASFLNIPVAKLLFDPDAQVDPKQTLINLARGSRTKVIRNSLVPEAGRSASEGPLYTSEIVRFVTEYWDPSSAREHSKSLASCLSKLQNF